MSERWQVSFRVGTTQDFEARYQEVLAGTAVPSDCLADVALCHDMVLAYIASRGIPQPLVVYMNGTHDYETTPAVTVMVSVQGEFDGP